LSTTLSKIWLSVGPFFCSFAHNSLVSHPFLTRKVSNRSSQHVSYTLVRGWSVRSIFGLVNGLVKPRSNLVNLGQTWSTLVKLPSSGKCVPDHVLRVSQAWWTLFGSGTARSNPGQHSVNLGQTWSTLVGFRETCPGPRFEVIWCGRPLSDRASLVRAVSFCVPTLEKIPGVKMGL
jgi:hypothetical protein